MSFFMVASLLLYTGITQSEISIQDNSGEHEVHAKTECC
ncbi:hypothetical protein M2387_000850 [Klebsiella sp. BIGb0407]|nr:hypothetical protein [Klebsiella sp. BIGb0407]